MGVRCVIHVVSPLKSWILCGLLTGGVWSVISFKNPKRVCTFTKKSICRPLATITKSTCTITKSACALEYSIINAIQILYIIIISVLLQKVCDFFKSECI